MPVIEEEVGLALDRIILATDFSPAAENAAVYAQGIAKRFSSTLSIAHVIDLSVATLSEEAVLGISVDEMRHSSAKNQERVLSNMTLAGVRATAHTLESLNPAQALVGFAREMRADLIVAAAKTHHGLGKAIMGSCAEGVIRHATCPVLTMGPRVRPAHAGAVSFNTILFATDFDSYVALEAAVAFSFARESAAQVYLCHVMDRCGSDISETLEMNLKFEAALQKIIPKSAYEWCDPETIVESGSVAEGILAIARRVGADLIVVGARHSGAWYTHLVEGVVGQVLAKAECPVLTVCGSPEFGMRHVDMDSGAMRNRPRPLDQCLST